MTLRRNLPWIAIFLAAFSFSLPGIFFAERACEPDSDRYLTLAHRFATHGCYCNADSSPHATTPPVYSIFTMTALLGSHPSPAFRPDSPSLGSGFRCRFTGWPGRFLLFVLQALLLVWSARCLERICISLRLPPSRSRAAALLYGLSPLPLVYAGRILSETLFVALLLTGVWLLLVPIHAARRDWLVRLLGGASIGLATLARAILVPWLFAWPVIAILTLRRAELAHRSFGRNLILGFAGALVVIAPWSIRNLAAFGSASLSAGAGTNALEYAAALVADKRERDDVLESLRGERPLANPFAESDAKSRAAWRIVTRQPLALLAAAGRTLPALFAPPVNEILDDLGQPRGEQGGLAALRERRVRSALGAAGHRLARASPFAAAPALLLCIYDVLISAAGILGLTLVLWPSARTRLRIPPRADVAAGAFHTQTRRPIALWLGALVLTLMIVSVGAWHPRFRVPLAPALGGLAVVALQARLRRASA